ncbi:MAG: rRNA maturation RNase YbeY [Clostridia bacterium]|nr:rRNA maturation RNase YbeY [Clostridia bacterium]
MNVIIEEQAKQTKPMIVALRCAAEHFKLPKKTEISLSIFDDKQIKELNARTREKDEVTDVLSFPYIDIKNAKVVIKNHKEDINPYTKCLMLGDICVNTCRADSQAAQFGHSKEREYAYLALHGFLHILGFHHYTPQDKDKMRRLEETILNKINLTR